MNNIKNGNCSDGPVISQVYIYVGCSTHSAGDSVMLTDKFPVLRGISVGQPDSTTIISTHIAYLPLPQISLSARRFCILLA